MQDTNFVERIKQIESAGRRFGKDGKILEGPQTKYGTAKGEMQVLDGTARDPGFGVVPARDGSPAELARVGADYALAMLKQFGGNEQLAAAAYNHGPGNVQKLVTKHGEAWGNFLPKETQNYLAKLGRPAPMQEAPQVAVATFPGSGDTPAAPVAVQAPAEMVAQVQPQAPAAPTPEMGPDAWQEFLRGMPQAREPVSVADLSYGGQVPPHYQPQQTRNLRPNFQAFSSWKGRAA